MKHTYFNLTTEEIHTGGILGLSPSNCGDHGLVVVTTAPRPMLAPNERASLNPAPDSSGVRQWTVTTVPVTAGMVNAERQRRIEAGKAFTVAGVQDPIPLQGRPFDMTVYQAKRGLALEARAAGNNDPIHLLRDAADVGHMLTADQVIELTSQALAFVEAVMSTSWAMKDGTGDFSGGIPADYTNDSYWP